MATNRKWLVVSPCSFFCPPDLRVPCVYLLLDCCRHTVRAPLPFQYIFFVGCKCSSPHVYPFNSCEYRWISHARPIDAVVNQLLPLSFSFNHGLFQH